MLFPILSEEIIKEKYENTLETRALLQKVMDQPPNIKTYVEKPPDKQIVKIPKKKVPLNYIVRVAKLKF